MAGPWEQYQEAPQSGPWAQYAEEPWQSPAENIGSRVGNLIEGVKLGAKAPLIGLGNMVNLVSDEEKNAYRAELATNANRPGGAGGQILGGAALLVPVAMLPGGLPAQVAGGAAFGLSQPADSWAERGINTAAGAAGAGIGQMIGRGMGAAGNRFMTAAESRAAADASRNSVRDATLKEVQAAGYVVPPSMAGAGLGSRILEGLSGKYKTNQLAGIKDQQVTDALLRKSVGLADDAPLTSEAMQKIRADAFQAGYVPVARAGGAIKTDAAYQKQLDDLVADFQGAARSFPGAVRDDINNLVNGIPGMHGGPRVGTLKVPEFDSGDAIKMIQILRDKASAAYASGDAALGKAAKGAAKAIEDQIERGLATKGEDGVALLNEFRKSRTLMAKAHTAEDAIREGGGVADAKVLGRKLQNGKPLTGEQATIGRFANNFGDVAGIPKSGNANPFTIVDAGVGGLGIGSVNPWLAALPIARVAARNTILSQPYQRAFVNPGSYGPGLLPRIPGAVAPAIGPMGAPVGVGLLQSK